MGRKITRKPRLSSKRQKAVSNSNDTETDNVNQDISGEVKKDSKVVKLSDSDNEIDSLFEEYAGKMEENRVVKLSDSDDEIESLLEEFIEEEINYRRSIQNVILSSDNEEMEDMVEEFSKNISKEEPIAPEVKDKQKGKKSKKKKATSRS